MRYSTERNSELRLELTANNDVHAQQGTETGPDALGFLLPVLFILSTLLFVLLLFLVCILLLKKRRGILLRDNDGPVDVSREDVFNDADGGLAGIEERWLETMAEDVKRNYRQAKSECSTPRPLSR